MLKWDPSLFALYTELAVILFLSLGNVYPHIQASLITPDCPLSCPQSSYLVCGEFVYWSLL